jgi:endoplasmic reticulum-Golgi intermediate compartment protein 3
MMRSLKAFNLYPRVSQGIEQSTAQGGLLSLISLSVMLLLILSESHSYFFSPPRVRLQVEASSSEKMLISVDISFFTMPCNSLVTFYTDTANEHFRFFSLTRSVLDSEGTVVSTETALQIDDVVEGCGSCYGAHSRQGQCCNSCAQVMEAYGLKKWKPPQFADIEQCQKFVTSNSAKGPGCRLTGDMTVNKVPGSIHFKNTMNLDRMTVMRFNDFHKVNNFVFKDPEANVGEVRGPADGVEIKNGFTTNYYLKLMAAVTGKGKYYEASENHLVLERPANPEVIFTYDIEPISTIYEEEKDFPKFLVSICAIVGGWYAITLLISKVFIN